MLKTKVCSKCEYLIFNFLISYFCFRHTLVNAKIWLDRMTENNDNLHNFDEELEHMKGKYAYENGELDKAFEIWQKIVKIKAVSYRYFEYDDPKYKEF